MQGQKYGSSFCSHLEKTHPYEIYSPLQALVAKSANMECISPIHNSKTSAIKTYQKIIDEGTIVRIQGTRCDGKVDCWNGVDEEDCGFSTFKTLFIGT